MTPPNRQTFDAALQEAEASLRAGEPRQALSRCAELLASYPDAVRALRLRARAFEALSNFQRASADYARVLEIVPCDADSSVNLALSLQDLRRPAEALAIVRQALESEPLNDEALRLARESGDDTPDRGRLLRLRQKFDAGGVRKAVAELREIAEAALDRPDVLCLLAELLYRGGAPIAAAEVCQRLLDEQPDCLVAHALLVRIWQRNGAEVLAAEHQGELARLDPDCRETVRWLSDVAPLPTRDVPAWIEPQGVASPLPVVEHADAAEHVAYVDSLIAPPPLPSGEKLVFERAEADDDGSDVGAVEPLSWEQAEVGQADAGELPGWLRDLLPESPSELTEGAPADEAPTPEAVARALGGGIEDRQPTPAGPGVVMEAGVPEEPPPAPPSARRRSRKAKVAPTAPLVDDAETPPPEAVGAEQEPVIEAAMSPPSPRPPLVSPDIAVLADDAELEPEVGLPPPASGTDLPPLEWLPAGSVTLPSMPQRAPPKRPLVRRPKPATVAEAPVASAPPPGAPAPEAVAPPKRGKKSKHKRQRDIVEIDDDGLLELARLAVVEQDFDRAERYFADFIDRGRRVDRALADLEEITQTRPQLWRYFELLGKLHTRKGRIPEALAAYQRALDGMNR